MDYRVTIELAAARPRGAFDEALAGLTDARGLTFAPQTTWLGKVRAVDAALPRGASRDDALRFARAVRELARRLQGSVHDPQLGHTLPPDAEVEWLLDGWAAAAGEAPPDAPAEPEEEDADAQFERSGADLPALEALVARTLAEPDRDAPGLAAALARGAALPGGPRLLLRLVDAGAPGHAAAAVEALGEARAREAFEPLLSLLLAPPSPDLDDDVVAAALARIDPAAAAAQVVAALEGAGADAEGRSRLLHALARVDAARAVPLLVASIRRAAAAGATSCEDDADFVLETWVQDEAALPAVLAALDDPLPAVRRALARALGTIGGPRAEAARARLASSDPDPAVRAAAS